MISWHPSYQPTPALQLATAWYGARIVLRQNSAEALGIFEFIMKLHNASGGLWARFVEQGVAFEDVSAFLEYSGQFLSSLGNYFEIGDKKAVPSLSASAIRKMAQISPDVTEALEHIIEPMFSIPPESLGCPCERLSSNYYLGETRITKEEISSIAKIMERNLLEPENTRIYKNIGRPKPISEILQASVDRVEHAEELDSGGLGWLVVLRRGDHAPELALVCSELKTSIKHTEDDTQRDVIRHYLRSFRSGSLEAYQPYKDPAGVRGEWQSIVSISDKEESAKMQALVENADRFIRTLPWAIDGENDGKGPFEATRFSDPAFAMVYSLTYVSSIHWEAQNLPNYNDIRQTEGSKNTVWVNRMSANKDPNRPCPYVHSDERKAFRSCSNIIRFVVTALHERLGHGTGKLLAEISPGKYNFDREKPPINSLTGRPIETWYVVGQTWTSVEGLLAMVALNAETQAWGSPHAQANFAILKHILQDGKGFMVVDYGSTTSNIYVWVDRDRIVSDGKPALGRMLLRLHIYRCTAEVAAFKEWYELLSTVDGEYEKWRKIVAENPELKWKFVQGNTFLGDDGEVQLKMYEPSNEGIIQSFAERNL
ncbi:dipeptidyl peptidase III [Xylaria digitata]|nr:dipeptidyl peptidase III [Xylaria digitata]